VKIIGINGYKRSGKGEVANAITHNFPGTVQQVGFADKLKVLGNRTLGFKRSDAELIDLADTFKVSGHIRLNYTDRGAGGLPYSSIHEESGREFYQNLGTEARDIFGDTFWIDQVLPRVAFNPSQPAGREENAKAMAERYPGVDVLAITDLRFENEAVRVLALGGEVWRVNRPGTESDGHASEQRTS
jgi:hypothetical protein